MMFIYVINRSGARTAVIIATCYGLDSLGFDKVGGGGILSMPIQIGPKAHPSCMMGKGALSLGVKQLGRGVDHPTSSSAKAKNE